MKLWCSLCSWLCCWQEMLMLLPLLLLLLLLQDYVTNWPVTALRTASQGLLAAPASTAATGAAQRWVC
jgi:hypothetical protein